MGNTTIIISQNEGLSVRISPLPLPFSLSAISLFPGAYWSGETLVIPEDRVEAMSIMWKAVEEAEKNGVSVYRDLQAASGFSFLEDAIGPRGRVRLVAGLICAEFMVIDEDGEMILAGQGGLSGDPVFSGVIYRLSPDGLKPAD